MSVIQSKAVREAYIRLPLALARKQRLKDLSRQTLGWIYRQTAAQMRSTAEPKTGSLGELPVADGVWEWGDYLPVKRRLESIEQTRSRLPQICSSKTMPIDEGDLASALAKFRLPGCERDPTITIASANAVDDGCRQQACLGTPDARIAPVAVTGGISEQRKETLEAIDDVKVIAFYLPQFHPIPENDLWWGKGFTEWTNVIKAKPNFEGHYQPHVPVQLGYYDLRVPEVMNEQARMAQQYGIHGFCYYYYWFGGKRLLEMPIERMLRVGQPNIPYCLCWANENWTRRWDGREHEILISQSHSDDDDARVIRDIIRYFRSANYIRVNGRPLLLVYRATLFPDFRRTASIWRDVCGKEGIRDIYLALVESFDLVGADVPPDRYGCDASVEFPPQGMADLRPPSGRILNANFRGFVADYRDLVARYASRPVPKYKRFRGVMPGWDNTPRRQDDGICFENATPGAFQAWLENAIEQTKAQFNSDERLLFVNAWNEWAEGAHLEPDRRFGDAFLQAVVNAKNKSAPDAKRIMVCPTDPARVGA